MNRKTKESSRTEKTDALRKKAHRLIPGGSHTYAKGDDQYPILCPGFLERGKGCHVWDVEGKEFIEYGMGLRSVTLGHAYGAVVESACKQMSDGSNFTRPSPLEVACAEELLTTLGIEGQVKFAKDGSTVVSAALKLARAATGRDMVAICGDHPFFSYDDWFIGSTGMPAGVPEAIRDMTVKFEYNDIESLERLFEAYPNEIAAVVMEPERTVAPEDGFLINVQELSRGKGAIFVLDEMITGFRWDLHGAQGLYGLDPDLSTFGKGLSNGFSVSALVGRRELMNLGGISHDQERVFLLSTTHGAENHALAATRKVLDIYRTEPVIETLYARGAQLRKGVQAICSERGLEEFFGVAGRDCNLVYFTNDASGRPSQAFRALFLQEMCRRGVIAPSFVVSYSHDEADIEETISALGGALEVYERALAEGVEKFLVGPAVKPVYRRYC